MPDAFIYDCVRTPRGRGKADGSLHEVTALNLATQALSAIKDRADRDQESRAIAARRRRGLVGGHARRLRHRLRAIRSFMISFVPA